MIGEDSSHAMKDMDMVSHLHHTSDQGVSELDLISELISAEQPGVLPGPRPPPADLLSDHSQHGRMQRQTSPQSSRPCWCRGALHMCPLITSITLCSG
ncbi:hypothetical protein INR49_022144 [Caranx melampygus]|nr:hypothetical protein INR49_022144 [Caranx melampygus]